ncbi:MAG: NAD(P)-dependent alcohol dehydrogenase [Verrucomicrobiae bacterium]|nr:NAD(P)-dependent alcohol dehydrogenase [Verrucomicrobiae bacterium]
MKPMKAIAYDHYGSLEALKIRDIDKPKVNADEVLVRVRAAGLHIGDCFSVRGAPFVMRIATGLLKPKCGVPGFDFAGEVEVVGDKVTQFQPGDEVFGASNGTCAEYVGVASDDLALKPECLTFEQAAAVPTSALAALHALRDVATVQPGQKVLINGASGGVGTFAVQIAKSFGAEVTGVCSTTNVDMVRSLGADDVIDYTQEDFTQAGPMYDLIFDNVENRPLSDCRSALKPSGMLVLRLSKEGIGEAENLIRIVATEALRVDGPENATLGSEQIPDGPLKGAAMRSVASEYVKSDPEAAAQWAQRYANEDYAVSVIEEVGDRWAERDPVKAVSWLEELPEGRGQSVGLSSAFGDWEDRDLAAATEYLSAMSESPQRDSAISGFSRGYAWQDPLVAIAWALDISDPALRQESVTRAGQVFFRRDPSSAREWLNSSGLPAEAQEAILNTGERRG